MFSLPPERDVAAADRCKFCIPLWCRLTITRLQWTTNAQFWFARHKQIGEVPDFIALRLEDPQLISSPKRLERIGTGASNDVQLGDKFPVP